MNEPEKVKKPDRANPKLARPNDKDELIRQLKGAIADKHRGVSWHDHPQRIKSDHADLMDPAIRIGHVHLQVADLERSLAFYRDALGFVITQRVGDSAAFLSMGGYHHHIGLNTWQSRNGSPPPPGSTGLYHFAILYPTRRALAQALECLNQSFYEINGAADHGVSEAIYLCDPDQNGVELYWDRPVEDWPRDAQGQVRMVTEPLDLEGLLAELHEPAP